MRVPGYDSEAKSLKADVLYRAHIFGKHVDDYMRNLPEENEEDKYDEDDKEEKDGDLDVSHTEKRFLVNDIESRSVWSVEVESRWEGIQEAILQVR